MTDQTPTEQPTEQPSWTSRQGYQFDDEGKLRFTVLGEKTFNTGKAADEKTNNHLVTGATASIKTELCILRSRKWMMDDKTLKDRYVKTMKHVREALEWCTAEGKIGSDGISAESRWTVKSTTYLSGEPPNLFPICELKVFSAHQGERSGFRLRCDLEGFKEVSGDSKGGDDDPRASHKSSEPC